MKERLLTIVSGLLFNLNTLNIYMARDDFPEDMLSDNPFVTNVVKIAKSGHDRDNDTVSLSTYKDYVSQILNIVPEDVKDHEDGKKYLILYKKARDFYTETPKEDFTDLWRKELKHEIDAYIRRYRLNLSRQEHLMMKNTCFAGIANCSKDDPCEIKDFCKEARKMNKNMLDYVQIWREEAEEKIRNLKKSDGRVKAVSYADISCINERLSRYEELKTVKQEKGTFGIPFSLPTLNKWTDGWVKQRACCIVGRTGQGKTAFAVHEELHAFMHSNTNVLHFNLEMPKDELLARLDSALTTTPFSNIIRGEYVSDEEFSKYTNSVREKLKEKKNEFVILDTPNMSISEFRYYVRQYYNKWGDNFIVCLDNLNIMKFIGKEKKTELVDEAAQTFHEIMKEYNISGMLLAQLNRDAEGEVSIRPSHFRDCDSIPDHMDWCAAILPYGPYKKVLSLVKGRNFIGDKIIMENKLNCMQLIECGNVFDSDEKFDEDEDKFIDIEVE